MKTNITATHFIKLTGLVGLIAVSHAGGQHDRILKDKDIKEIYQNFVSINYTQEYKYRYSPLPLEKNNKTWRWEGKDFPRVIAVLEFEKFVTEQQLSPKKALFVNGNDPEGDFLTCVQKKIISYNQDPENYDLHQLHLDEIDFDFVMLNQTLEHVYDPIRCLKNIYKYMQKGGILYMNVPVLNIPHDTPFHYYTGYTPVGLGTVTQAAGFKIIAIGQWGNHSYIQKLFSTLFWPDYLSLRAMNQNFSVNEFEHPVITWIFAQKE